ncbi:MAG: TIGR04013 family B12-binding domain/radical SAM domain-containing protein [Deltaproteobacteria bacterium]|nr:TIGR04013 family B12-binding domain/radical SAM domain-containing protein [Deltaproteobacteria bacterium]
MHARSGLVGLNVVTAALDEDPRTRGLEIRFARNAADMAHHLRELAGGAEGAVRPLLGLWSFYSMDFEPAARDLAIVREATADLSVLHVAGGVHATAEPLATLRGGFDLVAIGEGEHTMVSIVDALEGGADVRSLTGTAHLDARGALVSHGPGERPELDAFPPFNVRHRKWNALEITRGCVYACSFCQTPYMFKARFRHRSIPNVRGHVDAMRAQGSTFVRFLTPTSLSYGSDDTSVNLDAVDALLASVREGAGRDAKVFFGTFPSEIRPEHVSERALAILARWIDNRTLVVGGQSGSDRVLERTRRGHDVAAIVRAVELCVAAGFRPDVDFLLGLPGETEEDRALSMALAERLVGMGARIHSHAFMPLPGTPLRDATPEPIEESTALAMARLESKGRAYGQWRKQLVTAADLVRARRPRVS